MSEAGRRFRIEQMQQDGARESGVARHLEIMAAIDDLRRRIAGPAGEVNGPAAHWALAQDERAMVEAQAMKAELHAIQDAIERTKEELTALRIGPRGQDLARVTDELDAVVQGTEEATETILRAAEIIDQDAADLQAALNKSGNVDTVSDVREQVVRIFEACNFQDLTGQRITKVIATMRFVEERVERMLEAWGGVESMGIAPPAAEADTVHGLENGPALPGDEGHVSQDDIDALFG